jgi:hypothetical protein
MLNTSVNIKRILLDERVEMNVVVDPLMESTIYCRPFEEDVHNVSAFTVKGQEFVHNYVTSSDNQKYIVTNIITEDGDVHEDVCFKVVVVEDGTLPVSVVNLRKAKDTSRQEVLNEKVTVTAPVIMTEQSGEVVLLERVREYKKDLLTEFLTFSQVQQKHVAESLNELKENVNNYVEKAVAKLTRESVDEVLHGNSNIAAELEEKFKEYGEIIEEHVITTRDEMVENITNQLSTHEKKLIESIKPRIEKTAIDILKEKVESIERLLTLDKRVEKLIIENTALQQSVAQLTGERQSLKTLVESAKSYTDAQVSRASRDAEYYARRILDLGGGGGSVAAQYARGGVMDGDLTINGNILSGGNNLVNVFAGEGGGDDNPINAGEY